MGRHYNCRETHTVSSLSKKRSAYKREGKSRGHEEVFCQGVAAVHAAARGGKLKKMKHGKGEFKTCKSKGGVEHQHEGAMEDC